MNENLNLVEILKDCPKGMDLYSLIWGECKLDSINYTDESYPIKLKLDSESLADITKDGRHDIKYNGECTLFPSKDQRDWSKFKPKNPKFDPKTLQPFDKVLQFSPLNAIWICDFYSHKINGDVPYPYECTGTVSDRVIPYNDETKHLVGTNGEAPEYHRYWEG